MSAATDKAASANDAPAALIGTGDGFGPNTKRLAAGEIIDRVKVGSLHIGDRFIIDGHESTMIGYPRPPDIHTVIRFSKRGYPVFTWTPHDWIPNKPLECSQKFTSRFVWRLRPNAASEPRGKARPHSP